VSEEERVVMTIQVGKRYVCKQCGSEFIVTRGGSGTLECCRQPMELKSKETSKGGDTR
jgi:hypothetical protein